jgi:hypothetical protein
MSWLFYYIVFSFVLKQKKQKFKVLNLRRSNLFSNPKRKELASFKQIFVLRIHQIVDIRLPDATAEKITNYTLI